MNVEESTDIIIRRPLTEVAQYAANRDNAPAWYVNIKAVEWNTPPADIGSRVAFVAQFLGRGRAPFMARAIRARIRRIWPR
jgi:hypothetical protein